MTRWTSILIPLAAGLLASCAGDGARPAGDPIDAEAFLEGRYQYPGGSWVQARSPASLGWSEAALAEARTFFDGLDSAALMVVHRGVLIAAWGDVGARYNSQSIRKSLLSALIGTEVAAGRLDLQASLAELGIDDSGPPLAAEERRARVVDLLHTSSGVYRSALYEVGSWKRRRPQPGSHPPGSFWFYSNWDFNALGTIFERSSGTTIHGAFRERVAEPLQMEDFRERDVSYLTRESLSERILANASDHRAYVFMISARDLARFGLLYLSGGRWRERQVLSADWVKESWRGVSIGEYEEYYGHGTRYGYMWWVYPVESRFGQRVGAAGYAARGARGHRLLIIPDLDLVLVHRVATGGVGLLAQASRRFLGADSVSSRDLGRLVGMIVAAHPSRPT